MNKKIGKVNEVLEMIAEAIEKRRDEPWPDGPTYPAHYTECAEIVRKFKTGYEAKMDALAGVTGRQYK